LTIGSDWPKIMPVATERVKSGQPDDTKLPVLKFGIEEAAEVAKGIRYLPFRCSGIRFAPGFFFMF